MFFLFVSFNICFFNLDVSTPYSTFYFQISIYLFGGRGQKWSEQGVSVGATEVAMHWALTQFQGTSEIVPGSSHSERAYAVVGSTDTGAEKKKGYVFL